MSIFKCLQEIENGIRRGMIQKETTEKMGVPMVMGTGKDQKKLVDNVVSGGTDLLAPDEKSDDEETESDCKCKELQAGINFMGAAAKGGVEKYTTPEERGDVAQKKPGRKMSRQQMIHEAKKLKDERKDDKKSEKKDKKKKKGKAKSEAEPKGTSGPGSGSSGRTGPRKRRSTGEYWWAKSGNKPGAELWTKRSDGEIVRATPEQKKEYQKKHGKKDLVPEGDDEHKKRTEMVQHFKDARGLSDHLTKDARADLLKQLKNAGIDITDKDQDFLDAVLSELVYHKLTRGEGGPRRSPEQLKRDFLDGMDPQNYENHKEFNDAKKRVEGMNTGDFEAMIASIMLDEDDDVLRDSFGIEQMSPEVHGKLKGGSAKDYNLNDLFKGICGRV